MAGADCRASQVHRSPRAANPRRPPHPTPPQMPHYSTYSMPALSLHCGAHVRGAVAAAHVVVPSAVAAAQQLRAFHAGGVPACAAPAGVCPFDVAAHASAPSLLGTAVLCLQFAQWANDLSFRLFDYGSAAENRRHYGRDRPPSLAGGLGAGWSDDAGEKAGSADSSFLKAAARGSWDYISTAGPSNPPPQPPTPPPRQTISACWTCPWTCWRAPWTASSAPPAW